MNLTSELKVPTDNSAPLPIEGDVKLDFCVLRSPLNAQYVVARPGEFGTAGWQTLFGPNSSEACWAWIHSKPRYGLRF